MKLRYAGRFKQWFNVCIMATFTEIACLYIYIYIYIYIYDGDLKNQYN